MSNSNEFTATLSTIPSASGGGFATQVWTNFGPLTTTYTPPAVCHDEPSNQGQIVFSITSANSTRVSYDCGQATNVYIQNAACYPSSRAVEEFITVPASVLAAAYWSPGVFCPSAWTTASSATITPVASYSSIGGFENDIHSMIGNRSMDATFVLCCPPGYSLSGHCASSVTATTTGAMCDLNFRCGGSSSNAGSVCGSGASAFRWNPAETETSVAVYAYPIFMMQQDSDLVSTSSPVPGRPSTLPKPGFQSTSSVQGGAGGQKHHGSSSSVKTIVPAVVVPVVALIAFVAAVIFCLRARKRKARRRAEGSYSAVPWEKNGEHDGSTSNGDRAYSWRGASPVPGQRP